MRLSVAGVIGHAASACEDHLATAYCFVGPGDGTPLVPADTFAAAISQQGDDAYIVGRMVSAGNGSDQAVDRRVVGISKQKRERPVRCCLAHCIRGVLAMANPEALRWQVIPSMAMLDTEREDYACDDHPFPGSSPDNSGDWTLIAHVPGAAVPTTANGVKIPDTPTATSAKLLVATFREQRERWGNARLFGGAALPMTPLEDVAAELGLSTLEHHEHQSNYRLMRSPKTGQGTLILNGRRWWMDLSTGIGAVGTDCAEALRIYASAPVPSISAVP